jgi:hypothetical protein
VNPSNEPKWENFETLIENLPNLKGICIDISSSSSKTPIQTFFPLYEETLKLRGIKMLNCFEFDTKVEQLSQALPFAFHFDISSYEMTF